MAVIRRVYTRFVDYSGARAYTKPRVNTTVDALQFALSVAALSDATLYSVEDRYELGGLGTVASGPSPRQQGATVYFGDPGQPTTAIELFAVPSRLYRADSPTTIDILLPEWQQFAASLSFLGALRGGHLTEQAGR